MTLYETLSLTISFLGTVAVVATLIYLARQTGESTKQTTLVARSLRDSALDNLSSRVLIVSQIFIENPSLRKYFYYSKEIDTENPDYEKVEAIAVLFLDIFDYYASNKRLFSRAGFATDGIGWPAWEDWSNWIEEMFVNSPVLRKSYLPLSHWYQPELESLWMAAESRLSKKDKTIFNTSPMEKESPDKVSLS